MNSLNLKLWMGLTIGIYASMGVPAIAQIVPDGTLGIERSVLTPNLNLINISGGAQRQSNLFHSFSQFNIADGQSVFFASPIGIQNILTRVTGPDLSNIQGTLGVNGSANLFLLNPNGILFGPNARLNVQGSFVATTANAIQFGNQGVFSASNPDAIPLLTINPAALLFNQAQSIVPNIQVDRAQLSVPNGKSIGLIGGNIAIAGTKVDGQFNLLGGHIELASVAGPAVVGVDLSGDRLNLNVPFDRALGNIRLSNVAGVVATGDQASIGVNANQLRLDTGGRLDNEVIDAGNTGDITIKSRTIEIDGFASGIAQTSFGNTIGRSGNIIVNADSILLQNKGEITTIGYVDSQGPIGNVMLNATNLDLKDGAKISSENFGLGKTGSITINSKAAIDLDNALIFTKNAQNGIGESGDITISTKTLSLLNGSTVLTSTLGGSKGGNLTVTATDAIDVVGFSEATQRLSLLGTDTIGAGRSGDVLITTSRLNILDGGGVGTETLSNNPSGRGGDVRIKATQIEIAGVSPRIASFGGRRATSGIGSETGGEGNGKILFQANAGNITIDTDRLFIHDQGIISSSSLNGSAGNSGNIVINANDSIKVVGGRNDGFSNNGGLTIIRTETFGTGNAGNLTLNTGALSITAGGLVSSRAFATSTGKSGDVVINAQRSVEVSGVLSTDPINAASLLTARTDNSQSAGQLSIFTDRLLVSDRARISAEAIAGGTANNLTIKAKTIDVSNGSSISVNSPTGFAGQLNITAGQINLNQGSLTATTGLSEPNRQGAEINLSGVGLLLLRRGSLINATANNQAIGGNVNINSTLIVAVPKEDSDIRANAFQGSGGNIFIATQGILGTASSAQSKLGFSDITASSELGTQGTVAIVVPDVRPDQGLIELPSDLVDPTSRISQVCPRGYTNRAIGRFVISGKGGLATNPIDASSYALVLPPLLSVVPSTTIAASTKTPIKAAPLPPLIEAQGWFRAPDGQVRLITQAIVPSPPLSTANCFSNPT
jgi:filamentous hemagglutinin family protein